MEEIASIFDGLSVASGVAAIFAVGTLVAAIGFASWLTDKVAGFFYSHEEEEEFIYEADCVIKGETYMCPTCDYEMDSDSAMHAMSEGHCPKCGEDV